MLSSDLILENEKVLLRPLSRQDFSLLQALTSDPETWIYFTYDLSVVEEFEKWAEPHFSGERLQFTVIEKATGKVAGSTAFGNFSARDQRIEIGWTWLDRSQHGTGLNSTIKYLMLKHAFENWRMVRVQLKTAASNLRSQRAIEKLGAQREGVLRNHRRLADGRLDDTVLYSITDHDWPTIKQQLEARFSG